MKASLQTRVSLFITLIIIAISVISTYLFTKEHTQSKERGRIIRGTALAHSLSKAAEEGLIHEDLDLIKKASYIIKGPDVVLVQVYSNIWEAIDAYPLNQLKEMPHQEAVGHFKGSYEPFNIRIQNGYDFYNPIFFRTTENSPSTIIGYVRIVLSSADIQKELKKIVLANIIVAAIISLFAIISINVLIRRLVIKPVMRIYSDVSQFKNGVLPDNSYVHHQSADEIRELSREFNQMCRTIKEKEDKLVESGKRIRSLFERVEHAIFRLDKDGNIIEKNRRFTNMFGDVTELCNILIGDITVSECLKKTIAEKILHIEEKALGKKGEEFIISLTIYPDFDESGALKGFDGYIIDMTEKKRLEERLIRSQKMEAVGTLAGGMAHDFNNLLTAVLGYTEIMLDMTHEGDKFHKPATIIHEAAERGADLAKKILSVTRREKMETKPVNINDIIKSSMELLQRSIPKDIEIITNLSDKIGYIDADPSQMQQVIINLAVNARDAMPQGGKLIFETSLVGAENGAAGDIQTEQNGFVRLSISDTGAGMDKIMQRKIFDPFFTTKGTGKGTGLGLYIVHSIINNHGGYINLYSELLKGTRFNIYIPITRAEHPEESFDVRSIRGTGMILVIDDEPNVRELCKDMLEPLGYTVLSADEGNTGINIYRERQDRISLVILDMIMPKMGGSEVFQTLKTINPGVKILLCSGYSQNGFAGIEDLIKRGAAGFVQKPFSRQTIAVSIKKALSLS